MSEMQTLSNEQILALIRENPDLAKTALQTVADEKKAADEQRKKELAIFGADFIEHVIDVVPLETTESTGRVGRSVVSMPYTGADGVERTVSIHVTDTQATEDGKKRVKDAKAAKEKADKDAAAAAALGIK